MVKRQREFERETSLENNLVRFEKIKTDINLHRYREQVQRFEQMKASLLKVQDASEKEILNQRFGNKLNKFIRSSAQLQTLRL
jgi:hypothetical protein